MKQKISEEDLKQLYDYGSCPNFAEKYIYPLFP